MNSSRLRNIIILILIGLTFPLLVTAQATVVPANLQAQLLMKVMEFDRSLEKRVGHRLVLGILYQSRNRASSVAAEEFQEALESLEPKPKGKTVEVVLIDYIDDQSLEQSLKEDSVDVLYFSPLRSVSLKELTQLVEQHQIVTLTGVPQYVEKNVAVGIGLKNEKPQILINLELAKAEGADFSSNLLKMAKIYGKQE